MGERWRLPSPSTLVHGWHGRHDRLGPLRTPRAPAPPDNAAENGEQDEAADGGANANHDLFVVRQPRLDFFGRGGAFADAL